jgi:transcriptional regulator with XRE-family HTH domain
MQYEKGRNMETLGTTITNARNARNLRLRDLAPHLLKEDGTPISLSYLGLIEQDRCKPSPGLLPQLAAKLDIPEDVLHAALGHLPPDIKTLLAGASAQQVLDAFQSMRRTLAAPGQSHRTADEVWRPGFSGRPVSFGVCRQAPLSGVVGWDAGSSHLPYPCSLFHSNSEGNAEMT